MTRVEEIKERAEKATAGPWEWVSCEGDHHYLQNAAGEHVHSDGSAGGEYSPDIYVHGDDGQFIANSRADIDWLLERNAELLAILKRLRTVATGYVWERMGNTGDESDWFRCSQCWAESRGDGKHLDSCLMLKAQAAIAAMEKES